MINAAARARMMVRVSGTLMENSSTDSPASKRPAPTRFETSWAMMFSIFSILSFMVFCTAPDWPPVKKPRFNFPIWLRIRIRRSYSARNAQAWHTKLPTADSTIPRAMLPNVTPAHSHAPDASTEAPCKEASRKSRTIR